MEIGPTQPNRRVEPVRRPQEPQPQRREDKPQEQPQRRPRPTSPDKGTHIDTEA